MPYAQDAAAGGGIICGEIASYELSSRTFTSDREGHEDGAEVRELRDGEFMWTANGPNGWRNGRLSAKGSDPRGG
jgi:hypothetical protein